MQVLDETLWRASFVYLMPNLTLSREYSIYS